ncbi:hypothetical protein ACK8P5_00870 [Paenibacillus sp. EC2-1]|uniref:hypothetical protein n=1 Tax=Paenibacillus sp. EC2-1 TaxID=3388665 RepID=UPI003BEF1CDD
MWRKEIQVAMNKKQSIIIRLLNGEILKGIPESLTERLKLRCEDGTVWVPVEDIKHVSRLIEFEKGVR